MTGAPARPAVEFATGQATIKGEDVLLVRPRCSFPKGMGGGRLVGGEKHISDSASSVHADSAALHHSLPEPESKSTPPGTRKSLKTDSAGSLQGTGTFGLFCVFDGHNGAAAALHLEETLASKLEEKLPTGHPPSESSEPEYSRWREELQRALVETFCDLNEDFACKGQLAGTTVTVVLQYGWLLTVATLGDSRALLDTGSDMMQLSVDHRISTHQADRHRLEMLGAQIAPIDASGSGPAVNSAGYGPLRVWPGGLCLSRGIGDFDIGPPVIACPHIYQVRIPDTGGRLIVASDGLWDGFENMKRLCRMSRGWACQAAPNKIIQSLQRAYGGLRDDTSLVVLDIMPAGVAFTDLGTRSRTAKRSSGGGGCLCLSSASTVEEEDETMRPARAEVYTDLDVAAAVGLMPQKLSAKVKPFWCDPGFCEAICGSQVAACNAWNEARCMRSMGKVPSRVDLASFFSAVHHVKPLPETKGVDLHDLDVSTRPDLFGNRQTQDDVTVRPKRSSSLTLADAAASMVGLTAGRSELDGEGQNASQKFSKHVAQPNSFASKFGHYNQQLGVGSEMSTDESQRTGSFADDSVRDGERDWLAHMTEHGGGSRKDDPADHPRGILYAIDSAMDSTHSSSLALATVEEEAGPKKLNLEGIPSSAEHKSEMEMAVRRGKNRYVPGASKDQPALQHSRIPPLTVQ